MRIFAGPNGSGKSTIKSLIRPELLGVYVNPDLLESEMRRLGFLDLQTFEFNTTDREILAFFTASPLLQQSGLGESCAHLQFNAGRLEFGTIPVNSYFASVAADFIRRKLLDARRSFTFETVMSSRDKVEFLRLARAAGYRTYLYYIATDDPQINVARVRHRVLMGGHDVPADKIVSRYYRSLALLPEAIQQTDRSFVFDNSGPDRVWVAEITSGKILEMKSGQMPGWFRTFVWGKLHLGSNQP